MYSLRAQNEYGDEIELTDNSAYVITDITGFDPADATINATPNASADGTVFNSAYLNNRQIIITIAVNPPAEANRINLYTYFKPKHAVTLFYKNGERDVYINGHVQNVQVAYFKQVQTVQITIICTDPYLKGAGDSITDFSTVESLFQFPFDIEEEGEEFSRIEFSDENIIVNHGDVSTGVLFRLNAVGSVSNPKLYSVTTDQQMKLTASMENGDEIIINTRKKEKSIYKIHNGVKTNLIGALSSDSDWIELIPGDNVLVVDATSGALYLRCVCESVSLYEGV